MSKRQFTEEEIVQLWKNEEFRTKVEEAMNAAQSTPENPAGVVELSDEELTGAAGGAAAASTERILTMGCCGGLTSDFFTCHGVTYIPTPTMPCWPHATE
jgi:mersacidin/lichenicidin family type 2 lantibiotic